MEESKTAKYRQIVQSRYTASLFEVLGHPVRVRLVEALGDGKVRTIDQLTDLINLNKADEPDGNYSVSVVSPAMVGHHLGLLYTGGLVGWRRQGNRSLYWLTNRRTARLCKFAEAIFKAK